MRALLLAVCSCSMAFADLSETVLLSVNSSLNFDTGRIGADGADVTWDGSNLTPQNGAKLRLLGGTLGRTFDLQGKSYFVSVSGGARANPIPASSLETGATIVIVTSEGNIAKMLVVANNGALWTRIGAFDVTPAEGVPLVSGIFNNSSATPVGYPNYGIAPSSLFIVQGSGLADPGDPVLQDSTPGLPLDLNGASITVAVNGTTVHPALYYTSPGQLAAVLPASTPVGLGTLTVTYRGKTSEVAPMQVVPSALGINTYYGGVGVATDAISGAILTYTNSGAPGEIITLWATGLGSDPADSDTTLTNTPHPVGTPLQIYVGGIEANILYAGASAFPGVNQINLVIPPNVVEGCFVSLTAVTNGKTLSNSVTLPVHAGGGVCVDRSTANRTGDQIVPGDGISVKGGTLGVGLNDTPKSGGGRSIEYEASGGFSKYAGVLSASGFPPSPGGCTVGPPDASGAGQVTLLDTGKVHLNGPGSLDSDMPLQFGLKGTYALPLTAANIPDSGGAYTFQGSGGADVGPFNATVNLIGPLWKWTNPSVADSIDKTKPLMVTWSGGNPGSDVYITGATNAAMGVQVKFECVVKADAGQFTIPAYVLSALPDGSGSLVLQNIMLVPFTASGLDTASVSAGLGYTMNATFSSGS